MCNDDEIQTVITFAVLGGGRRMWSLCLIVGRGTRKQKRNFIRFLTTFPIDSKSSIRFVADTQCSRLGSKCICFLLSLYLVFLQMLKRVLSETEESGEIQEEDKQSHQSNGITERCRTSRQLTGTQYSYGLRVSPQCNNTCSL